MFKKYPLTVRFISFVFIPIVVTIGGAWIWLSSSVSTNSTSSQLNYLGSEVTIQYDRHGIAYINAASSNDAFFALGYTHARDRLWQLTIQQRLVTGRLSEVFGKETANTDIWMRTLGLHRRAQSSYQALSEEAKQSLIAYSNGINAWLDQKPTLPPEFYILGIKPEPWEPADSIAWIKLFALNLSGNMWQELARVVARKMLSEQQLSSLFQAYPLNGILTLPEPEIPGAAVNQSRLTEELYALALSPEFADQMANLHQFKLALEVEGIGGPFVGSNVWAVTGKHTVSGKPLLANDPHLELQQPSQWYTASLKGGDLNVTGMSLVGLPIIVFGRNDHIAWGGSNMMLDNQDLVVEQSHLTNPELYLANTEGGDQEWLAYLQKTEKIIVKADSPKVLWPPLAPINLKLRETIHGPVISDAIPGFEHPVSLQWTGLNTKDTSYESFYKLNFAVDWTSFKNAFTNHIAPALNMVYADDSHIGYLAVGRIPLRTDNYGNTLHQGKFPIAGWSDASLWENYIPVEDMPQLLDPKSGFIVNANNKIVGDSYPYSIEAEWALPARAQRITDLLKERITSGTKLDSQFMEKIQQDQVDLTGISLAKYLAEVIHSLNIKDSPNKKIIRLIAEQLAHFEGDMTTDSASGATFHTLISHLRQAMYLDEIQHYWQSGDQVIAVKFRALSVDHQKILEDLSGESTWCDNKQTKPLENCKQTVKKALFNTIETLRLSLGEEPDSWHWGNIHTTLLRHRPFSKVRMLDSLFERRFDTGGSTNTINVSDPKLKDDHAFESIFGVGFRQIIDMSGSHFAIISSGQSGNRFSQHYSDQAELFFQGKYLMVKNNKPVQILTLLPKL